MPDTRSQRTKQLRSRRVSISPGKPKESTRGKAFYARAQTVNPKRNKKLRKLLKEQNQTTICLGFTMNYSDEKTKSKAQEISQEIQEIAQETLPDYVERTALLDRTNSGNLRSAGKTRYLVIHDAGVLQIAIPENLMDAYKSNSLNLPDEITQNPQAPHTNKTVPPPPKHQKKAAFKISQATLTRASREKSNNDNKRACPQENLFLSPEHEGEGAPSATTIAAEHGLVNGSDGFEYSHLIAYQLIGKNGHKSEWITIDTYQRNSMFMFIDLAITHAIRQLKTTCEVEAVAICYKNTHIAKDITYTIGLGKGSLTLYFDHKNATQTPPTILGHFYKALLTVAKKNEIDLTPRSKKSLFGEQDAKSGDPIQASTQPKRRKKGKKRSHEEASPTPVENNESADEQEQQQKRKKRKIKSGDPIQVSTQAKRQKTKTTSRVLRSADEEPIFQKLRRSPRLFQRAQETTIDTPQAPQTQRVTAR